MRGRPQQPADEERTQLVLPEWHQGGSSLRLDCRPRQREVGGSRLGQEQFPPRYQVGRGRGRGRHDPGFHAREAHGQHALLELALQAELLPGVREERGDVLHRDDGANHRGHNPRGEGASGLRVRGRLHRRRVLSRRPVRAPRRNRLADDRVVPKLGLRGHRQEVHRPHIVDGAVAPRHHCRQREGQEPDAHAGDQLLGLHYHAPG
mmetsp:Transcript_3561/g.10405  ORF Transcript_3561/g.10405 Transcript_3561/m.10405 type:complete len:206 (-) Transcript_3561:3083-3700(-)